MRNVPLLTSSLLAKHGFRHGFSTRQGGVSAAPFDSLNLAASVGDEPDHVAENQRRFAASVGYVAEQLFTLSQVHGCAVRLVSEGDQPERLRLEQGDALVAPAGFPLGVRSADCVPLLLVDPHTRYVAAVHAGWRGVLAQVVPAALDKLCATSGASASRICAAIFPHIRGCCFEVDAQLAQQLAAASPGPQLTAAEPSAQSVAQLSAAEPSAQSAARLTAAEPDVQLSPRRAAAELGLQLTPPAAERSAQPNPQLMAAEASAQPPLGAAKALVALDAIVRAQLLARGVLAPNIDDVPGCTSCDRERFFSYRRDGARSGRHLTVVLG